MEVCVDFCVMKGKITGVINMQTSSRWQTRLGFENLNYFCMIIYLPVHRFSISHLQPSSSRAGLNYTRQTFIYDAHNAQMAAAVIRCCDVLRRYRRDALKCLR